MSEFYKEVGTLFGQTELQSADLERGLVRLVQEFKAASEVGSRDFSSQFYQKFEQLVTQNGIMETEVEALVNVLYFSDDHQQLVTFVVPSYYNAGGDRAQFADTYQLMMDDVQQAAP
ncbi:hypothetical protein [Acinetobacter tianfuensis]|uniref:Uncharacterized protein n=1 Tax=Acinetobacter tianfuensis TaxID=2419603 RepID=A0A3A8E636_9GAMM|nr:hypothetical protein [Acinetobacter tianfuensis]RKG30532.1 hypothetical protein D7V32_10905 [Acinetobacter tianfuensis]